MTSSALLIFIGRVVFGLFFLFYGARNLAAFKKRLPSMTNYGKALPVPLVAIGFASQVIGGLSLTLGLWTQWGAALLIAFLVLATVLYHNLFVFKGAERDQHLYLVTVNIAFIAGLLMIIASAP